MDETRDHRLHLAQEMRAQNFDLIRFASYRTACKLRFIQKKLNLHLVDIWNVIEAFREHSLNTLQIETELSISRCESLVSSLYENLNKRLPPSHQVVIDQNSSALLNWLISAYSLENTGRIRVFSIKVALATMCAGKLMDKLRYVFSQICDENGYLVISKFSLYLRTVLSLPACVYETPSFPYTEELSSTMFSGNGKVTVNDFLDTMMSDPGPPVMVWLPLLHRMASVENVMHSTQCDSCLRKEYTGFRYKCVKCSSYTMCQDCFWTGRATGGHSTEHAVREYSSYKSPSKQIGHSLRKSFRCVPDKPRTSLPRYPDQPEKTLNLSHIVPPSPLPPHNGFPDYPSYDMGSLDSRSTARSPGKGIQSMRIDDEHRLIARYAARLAQEAQAGRSPIEGNLGLDNSRAQRELILQLEAKNREIMREITRLRRQQETALSLEENPALMSELRALRKRKEELESHLTSLQDSRRHLMLQLEGLMKLLKNHQNSPKSTPNTSPRSSKSPPPSSRSAPPTPTPNSALDGNDIRTPFGGSSCHLVSNSASTMGGRSLCNDLLEAADSVTNAMSSLVRELNSGSDQDETPIEDRFQKTIDFENSENDWKESGGYNGQVITKDSLSNKEEQSVNNHSLTRRSSESDWDQLRWSNR
ncbi:dystrobrevin beta [Halyomorpha halys]|uniref:dystrobrevin beta n=1 Tax=Halyomorpha halys TaxID=286706 RepID=UPI0006D4FEB3|nr:dystrobrevin beta [Halyomorpha halys]